MRAKALPRVATCRAKTQEKIPSPSGQVWSHVQGSFWGDIPRYPEMFLGRKREKNKATSKMRENVWS